jgi:hypothetical protein
MGTPFYHRSSAILTIVIRKIYNQVTEGSHVFSADHKSYYEWMEMDHTHHPDRRGHFAGDLRHHHPDLSYPGHFYHRSNKDLPSSRDIVSAFTALDTLDIFSTYADILSSDGYTKKR